MRGLGAKVRDRPGAVVDHEYDVRLDLALIADVAHRRFLDASQPEVRVTTVPLAFTGRGHG
ncbi:hypothetical protein GFL84_01415 [Rhizobium leguminosarum bv. viciae]|nr:hypothetical protein [Rhizobium leguminosarum bv. viciae]